MLDCCVMVPRGDYWIFTLHNIDSLKLIALKMTSYRHSQRLNRQLVLTLRLIGEVYEKKTIVVVQHINKLSTESYFVAVKAN